MTNQPKQQCAINSRREGFAIAAAVLAMMVVGAIVTGGFYAASQQGQIAKSSDAADLALYIAETGLTATMGSVTGSALNAITVNTSLSQTSATVTYGGKTVGSYQTSITRLTQVLFVVRSVGTVTLGGPYAGATRTVASIVRVRSVDFDNNTAVQVYGNLTVGGSSDVNGNDWFPTAWTGCTATTGNSAVLANPTSNVDTQGSGTITGPVTTEPMDSADFNVFGDMGFDEIATLANYRFPATVTVGPEPKYNVGLPLTCRTTLTTQDNWGAPTNVADPCYSWFPIIEAVNGLRIASSGTGQGILLVRGDLEVSGGFTFYGVVVVRGEIRMTGTGGHINGTLITYGNGDLSSSSTTLGNSLVQYSSCAIARAAAGNSRLARGSPIANRSWMDITNIQNSY